MMWCRRVAHWWRHRPDGAAAAEAQRHADAALEQSLMHADQSRRLAWDARAVRRETDRVAREIERTMRPRETG